MVALVMGDREDLGLKQNLARHNKIDMSPFLSSTASNFFSNSHFLATLSRCSTILVEFHWHSIAAFTKRRPPCSLFFHTQTFWCTLDLSIFCLVILAQGNSMCPPNFPYITLFPKRYILLSTPLSPHRKNTF